MLFSVVHGREECLKGINMLYTLLFWKYAETKSILCSHQVRGVTSLIDGSGLCRPDTPRITHTSYSVSKESSYHPYTNGPLASKTRHILTHNSIRFEGSPRICLCKPRTEDFVYDLKSKHDAIRTLWSYALGATFHWLFKPGLSQRKAFLFIMRE